MNLSESQCLECGHLWCGSSELCPECSSGLRTVKETMKYRVDVSTDALTAHEKQLLSRFSYKLKFSVSPLADGSKTVSPESTEPEVAQSSAHKMTDEDATLRPFGWTDLRYHWERSAREDKDYRTIDERKALEALYQAYDALRKQGWQDIVYCPKDGTTFLSISAGCTGVSPCHYSGEWPTGAWWVHEAGDLWPAHPILWKPMPEMEKES